MVSADPAVAPRQFVEEIGRYCDSNGADIVLPTMDETYVLAAHVETLRGRVRFLLPSNAQIA